MALHSPRILSLCTGIGGLELGIRLAEPGARAVCYVEREGYAAAVVVARIRDEALDQAPVWSDLRTFDGRPWRGKVDLITGGYPCQPFSQAGKMRGESDPRHLWPEIRRIIGRVSPAACFFENVPNHLNIGFRSVCEDLWDLGFRVEAGIYSAAEVGAPHLRKRLFILAAKEGAVADPDRAGQQGERGCGLLDGERAACGNHADGPGSEAVANASRQGWEGRSELEHAHEGREAPPQKRHDAPGCRDGHVADAVGGLVRVEPWGWRGKSWPGSPFPPGPGEDERWREMPDDLEPSVRRGSDGLSSRVDRLRVLGNAVVPQVAAFAWTDLWRKVNENA